MSAIQLNVIGTKTRTTLSHEPTRAVLAEIGRAARMARDDAALRAIQAKQPYQTGVNQHVGGLVDAGWRIQDPGFRFR